MAEERRVWIRNLIVLLIIFSMTGALIYMLTRPGEEPEPTDTTVTFPNPPVGTTAVPPTTVARTETPTAPTTKEPQLVKQTTPLGDYWYLDIGSELVLPGTEAAVLEIPEEDAGWEEWILFFNHLLVSKGSCYNWAAASDYIAPEYGDMNAILRQGLGGSGKRPAQYPEEFWLLGQGYSASQDVIKMTATDIQAFLQIYLRSDIRNYSLSAWKYNPDTDSYYITSEEAGGREVLGIFDYATLENGDIAVTYARTDATGAVGKAVLTLRPVEGYYQIVSNMPADLRPAPGSYWKPTNANPPDLNYRPAPSDLPSDATYEEQLAFYYDLIRSWYGGMRSTYYVDTKHIDLSQLLPAVVREYAGGAGREAEEAWLLEQGFSLQGAGIVRISAAQVEPMLRDYFGLEPGDYTIPESFKYNPETDCYYTSAAPGAGGMLLGLYSVTTLENGDICICYAETVTEERAVELVIRPMGDHYQAVSHRIVE